MLILLGYLGNITIRRAPRGEGAPAWIQIGRTLPR
jgi:hypothetical protein